MAWIESHQELGRHPKTRRMARLLGIGAPQAVGHLHFLWWWALEFAQDGDLSRFDAADLADAAMWEGEPEQFVSALINAGTDGPGFIERGNNGTLVLHGWLEYAGRLLEQRKLQAQRSQRKRELYDDPALTASVRRRDGDRCRYCGKAVSWRDRKSPLGGTYDHVDPEGPNTLENLVVACRGCNSGKGRRTPEAAGMTLLPAPNQSSAKPKSARDLPGTKPDSPVICYYPNPNQEVVVDSAHAHEDDPPAEPSAEEQAMALMRRHCPTWFSAGRPYQMLLSYADDLGWQLVLMAVKRTLAAGKTHIGYCNGILKRWFEADLKNPADVEANEARTQAEREQSGAQRKARSPTRDREIYPIDEMDWSKFDAESG